MIDSKRIEQARRKARERMDNAKLVVDVSLNGRMSEPMQLAHWHRIQQNPQLEKRLRNKYGEQKWQDYVAAMGELEQKLGGRHGLET